MCQRNVKLNKGWGLHSFKKPSLNSRVELQARPLCFLSTLCSVSLLDLATLYWKHLFLVSGFSTITRILHIHHVIPMPSTCTRHGKYSMNFHWNELNCNQGAYSLVGKMWKLKLERNILQRDLSVKRKCWDYIGRQQGVKESFWSWFWNKVCFDNIDLIATSRMHWRRQDVSQKGT